MNIVVNCISFERIRRRLSSKSQWVTGDCSFSWDELKFIWKLALFRHLLLIYSCSQSKTKKSNFIGKTSTQMLLFRLTVQKESEVNSIHWTTKQHVSVMYVFHRRVSCGQSIWGQFYSLTLTFTGFFTTENNVQKGVGLVSFVGNYPRSQSSLIQ